jgi:hypothetical protein
MNELFPQSWFAAGVVTPESAADFARYAAAAPTVEARHWRWSAFRDWSEEREALSESECRRAYALGRAEPDQNLGTAIMCHALYQRNCPADVREAAKQSDRSVVRRAERLASPARS